jgi:hypothetical protein
MTSVAEQQVEIAKRGMDAAFSYTKAAINAAFEAQARSLGIMAQLAGAMMPAPAVREETWEWSGAPKRPHSTLFSTDQDRPQRADPVSVWMEAVQSSTRIWFKPAPSPFAWWAWVPQSAVPITWPWAYGMIQSGIPESVAWPLAEANAALFDAASKTVRAAKPVYPFAHSGSGFAVQVWSAPSPVLKTLLAAAPASVMLWPWVDHAA